MRSDIACAPAVADRGGGNHPQATVAENVHRSAGRDTGRPVGLHVADLLHQDEVRVAELLGDIGLREGRAIDVLLGIKRNVAEADAAVEERLQRGRHVARAVVEAEPVEIGTVIGQAALEGGFGIAADASADFEEALVGHGARRQVDHTAAEFARKVGRIGLLHQAGGHDVGGKDIERNHAAERLRGRQRQAIQQGQRIAIAKAAHVDEALPLHGQAGDATQRAGNVAFAGPCDLFGGQHVDHLGRIAGGVAIDAPRHDDRTAGNRNVRILRLALLVEQFFALHLLLCGRYRATGRILGEGRTGKGERGGEQEQPRQPLAISHCHGFPCDSIGHWPVG